MIQIFPKVVNTIAYGQPNTVSGVVDGAGQGVTGTGHNPLPIPATLRNLTLYDGIGFRTHNNVTVWKNTVATSLTTSLDAGAAGRQSTDTSNSVSLIPGDDILYFIASNGILPPVGDTAGITIEIEADGMIFGVQPMVGSILAGDIFTAGALGNGLPAQAGSLAAPQATYSICAVAGVIDHLCLKRFTGASGGAWQATLVVNGEVQNGSFGTVDTTTTLFDNNASGFIVNSFAVHVLPGDYVWVATQRLTTGTSFGSHVSIGIAMTPTTPGQFMFCGGSNDTVGFSTWKWNRSGDASSTEGENTTVIGQRSINLTGYIFEFGGYQGTGPGIGSSITATVRRDAENTPVTASVVDNQRVGIISGLNEVFPAGSRITNGFSITGAPDPAIARFHWGIAAKLTPLTGTLIVTKNIIGATDLTTTFPIAAGGGLSPSLVHLHDGESHQFNNVDESSGYSIDEPDPPSGYALTSIVVSNGSPSTNITIDADEIVTVTVTNHPVGVTGCVDDDFPIGLGGGRGCAADDFGVN